MTQRTPTTVLLIEDSPSDVRLVEELLRQSSRDSFHVLTASTLAKGLELLSANSVDAVLLDLGLPDSQGIDTLRAVHTRASHLPIIVLTVSDDEILGEQALQEGAQRFLSKDAFTLGAPYAGIFTRMIRFAIAQARAEAALAKSEQRYHQLVDTANVIILTADPQLTITYCNDYTLQLLGYTADEFIGKPVVGTLLPPTESTGRDLAEMARDILDHPEKYEHNRNEVMTKDGRRLWIEWTNAPQYDGVGNYAGILSTGIDVTERIAAEAAQRASEQHFQTFFNSSAIAQVYYDATGYPIRANAATLALFGIADVTALQHMTIFSSPRLSDDDKARLQTGEPVEYEQEYDFDAIKASGGFATINSGTCTVRVYFTPLHSTNTGSIDGYLGQITDITERVRAERLLQAAYQDVQALNERLRIANEELEQRVEERTEKLASVNEELQSTNEGLRVANEELHHETEQRTRAEKEARHHAERTAVLNKVIHVLNEAPDVPTLYERIITTMLEQLGLESGLIATASEDGTLAVEYAYNHPLDYIKAYNGLKINDNPLMRKVYEQHKVVVFKTPPPSTFSFRMGLKGAAVGIPFLSEGKTVGHVSLHTAKERTFTNDERALFKTIGLELGTTVAKLQAKARAEEYARQQGVINRVIKAGNEADTLPTALSFMLDAAMELVSFTDGAVFLLNEAAGVTEQWYARGFNDEVLERARCIPLATSFYAEVYAGTPKFFNDYLREGTEQFTELLPDVRILAVVPLVAKPRVIGHYVLASARKSPFTDEERALLIAIGQQAGTVIARLQADEAARTQAQHATLLNKIIKLGNTTTNVHDFLRDVCDMLTTDLGYDAADMRIITDRDDIGEQVAATGYPAEFNEQFKFMSINDPILRGVYHGEPYFPSHEANTHVDLVRATGMASNGIVPLAVGERIIGDMGVAIKDYRPFSRDEQTLLIAIGQETGTVIARLQTQEDLTQELETTSALARLSAPLLSPSADLSALTLAILTEAKQLTDSVHGFVAFVDPNTKDVLSYGHTKMMLDVCVIDQEQRKARFPIGPDGRYHPLWGYPLNEKKGFFTNAPSQHPASTGTPGGHVTLENFLAVPALLGGQAVGEIALANSRRDYTQRDVEVVERLAEVFALTLLRMRADASTKEQAELINLASDAIIVRNLDHRVTFWNKGAEALFGWTADEARGKHAPTLLQTVFDTSLEEAHAELLEAGHWIGEVEMATKTGEKRYVEQNWTLRRDDEGNPVAILTILHDVTERRHVEMELKRYSDHLQDLVRERTAKLAQSEEEFRSLFDESSIAQIRYDIEGLPIRMNKAAAELFGVRDVSDIRHRNMFASIQAQQADMARLREGHPLHFEQVYDFQAIRDGDLYPTTRSDVRHFDLYILPLTDAAGTFAGGYLAQIVDLTDLREAEEALKNAERLAGIGESAAMIGHDLRNPLQGLQYIVDLQKLRFERIPLEKRGAEDWQNEQALFDRISEQIFYMDKIVADLQDYARPIAPEHQEITIRTVIDDVLESLPPADGVETIINVRDLTFTVDPHLMIRVFSNLILNAVQAMSHGGTLTIGAEATDGSVAIRVSDTGVGIPADMRDKLFSPLTTGKAKGTGLGLAVVKRIVDAHNGTITFESEEGKGTTFTVMLPQMAE